jgi:hypothetical protein
MVRYTPPRGRGWLRVCIPISILIFSFIIPSYAQDNVTPRDPVDYSINGDNVQINFNEDSGEGLLHADGNVIITFAYGVEEWEIHADVADIRYQVDPDDDSVYFRQEMEASGNVLAIGPGIEMELPGMVFVDLLNGKLTTDSETVNFKFENGHLSTGYLEVVRVTPEEPPVESEADEKYSYDVHARGQTSLTYDLSREIPANWNIDSSLDNNIFGSLMFDFSQVTVETIDADLTIRNEEPGNLNCRNESIIHATGAVLTLPSFTLNFNPRYLTCDSGVEILVGEESTITAGSIRVEYPEEGGMFVTLEGSFSLDPEIADLMKYVRIVNPLATFEAAIIEIVVMPDGSQKVTASGGAKFEMEVGELIGAGDNTENQSD